MIARTVAKFCYLILAGLLASSPMVFGGDEANPNVLIIHAYRSNMTPYPNISSAFEATLVQELGRRVEFYEAFLDSDRSDASMEAALAEFLHDRFATRHLDLIVTIAAPAAQFVVRYRDSAFAGIPVLFLGADPRFLSSEAARKNATAVRHHLDPSAWIQDILQIAPDTRNIVVIQGASSFERTWTEIMRRDLQGRRKDLNLAFLEGLSLDQVEKQISTLPSHSFIILGLFVTDPSGVAYDQSVLLRRLHAVANAPIYGLYQSNLGSGIIGGRLYQDQMVANQGGRTAARILRGEPASNIPPQLVQSPFPAYDWRELRRWRISESRLPAGSSLLFREPTTWERYRLRILGIAAFVLLETLLIVGLLINLRNRRRMEASLRQSEERYRRLFEAESDAIFLLDGETGRILDSNPAAETMYGYGGEEFLRLRHEDLSAEPEHTRQALRAGLEHVPLRRHRRKNGTIFPVEISAGSLQEGGRKSYVVAMRDISKRLEDEERLRQSEHKYRRLHESMRDAFVSVDLDGHIMEFNRAYEQMLGYTGDELRRLTYEQITPERWHAFEARIIRDQVLSVGYSEVYEKEYRRKDDTVFAVELRSFLIRDEAGKPQAMWAIVRDISERKHANEALRLSEERFRQVAETVSDFVWEVDADGLYTYTSPSVDKILGYTPDELVGKVHFYDLFVPEVREELKAAAFQVFAAKQHFQAFPNSNISKSGGIVYLETSGMPVLDDSGCLVAYRGADTDVTDRRRAEMETQLLHQELSLFSRFATIGQLTGSIAHELNQPLSAILSNSQAGLSILQSHDPDLKEVREIFADIVSDNQRAADVIRSIRSMLKREEPAYHPLLPNNLIMDVMAIVRNDALRKRISLTLDLGSPMASISGNRVQLEQVILNLVMNAFESMEPLEDTRELILRTRQIDKEIILSVTDSGEGIPSGKLSSVFEPFYTTKASGLGLGLSLSRSIVTAHNGRLWAENNPDRGATFFLALPAHD